VLPLLNPWTENTIAIRSNRLEEELQVNNDQLIPKEKSKKRELIRMFEPIEGEMELIWAGAKFNYTLNKRTEKTTLH